MISDVQSAIPKMGNGVYIASGHFTPLDEGPVWVALTPSDSIVNRSIAISSIEHQLKPVLNVSSSSDTLQVDINMTVIKIGFVFGSFSILAIQPLLAGIFIKDEHRKNT